MIDPGFFSFQTLRITLSEHVAQVIINRPEKANALDQTAWDELRTAFNQLDDLEDVRVIILSGEGRHFCAGIDLSLLMSVANRQNTPCDGRSREQLRKSILELQAPINAIERCAKPVIAAIQGGCMGAGIDLICGCDMRYCTEDSFFTIKEIDMGMVADLGTLQRLPKLIGEGIVREMAYTGRNVGGKEAAAIGIVNRTFPDKEKMMTEVNTIAATIAAKSPLAIRGTKQMLQYTRDHSVEDGLKYVATWNAAMLLSADLTEALEANQQKRKAMFGN